MYKRIKLVLFAIFAITILIFDASFYFENFQKNRELDLLWVESMNPAGTTMGMPVEEATIHETLREITINFNNPVDKASINEQTLQVLSGLEAPEPIDITYSKNDTRLLLKLKSPISPGDTTIRITVFVDGVRDIYGSILSHYINNIDIEKTNYPNEVKKILF